MSSYKLVCDIPTERAVLSGLAQYGKNGFLEVQDVIHIEDFTNNDNKIIWRCLEHTVETHDKIDIPSLMASASSINLYDAINTKSQTEYIRSIFNMPIELDNIRPHAKKLRKLTIIREAQRTHKEAYENLASLQGEESIDSILATSEAPVFNLINKLNYERKDIPEQIAVNGKEKLKYLIANPIEMAGIPTPWKRLNAAIGGGIRNGGVTLIAARPKTGKSTLAKEVGIHVSSNVGIPVLMLDTEMLIDEQFYRCIAGLTGIKIKDVETGKFGKDPSCIEKAMKANELLLSMPLKFQSVSGKDFEQILSIIRRWITREVGFDENGNTNPCLVIYDYFKLKSLDELKSAAEHQIMGFQIAALTDFCKEYDFPCLAFVQTNRGGDVAQSDRLLWTALALCIFKRKDSNELAESGKYGNMKIVIEEARFGPALEEGDYINMKLKRHVSYIEEGLTKFEANKAKTDEEAGFEVNNAPESETKSEEKLPW